MNVTDKNFPPIYVITVESFIVINKDIMLLSYIYLHKDQVH